MVRLGRGYPIQPATVVSRWNHFLPVNTEGLTINGVLKDLQDGWRISETLNNRNTMRFTVISKDGTYRPSLRDEVIFVYSGVRLFAGLIHQMDESGLGGGSTPIDIQIGATDYGIYLDRRLVGFTLSAGTLKSQLTTVVTYLTGYGVALDLTQVNGPTLTELVYSAGTSLKSVLDELSEQSTYVHRIDYTKKLSMFTPGTTAAPFNVTTANGYAIGDVTVSPTVFDYANKIFGRYSEPAQKAYAYFELYNIPTADKTVTVGNTAYIWKVAAGAFPEVTIGGSIATSIDNLVAVGAADPECDIIEQSSNVMRAMAKTAGAAGNSIVAHTTMSVANGEWYGEGTIPLSNLYSGTDVALTGEVTAQNVGEQSGGANLVEKYVERSDVLSETAMQAIVDGILARSIVAPREIHYTTLTTGVHPGMSQTLTFAERGVSSSTCLINSVEIYAAENVIRHDITAVESLVIPPDYRDTYRNWSGDI